MWRLSEKKGKCSIVDKFFFFQSVVRKIEQTKTDSRDKPELGVKIVDCGEITDFEPYATDKSGVLDTV